MATTAPKIPSYPVSLAAFNIAFGYILTVALISYLYYTRPMAEPKPTIQHVRIAEADAKATKEAYLSARGWSYNSQKELWEKDDCPSLTLDDAVTRQDYEDQKKPKRRQHDEDDQHPLGVD